MSNYYGVGFSKVLEPYLSLHHPGLIGNDWFCNQQTKFKSCSTIC